MVLTYHCGKKKVSIPSASKVTVWTDTQTETQTRRKHYAGGNNNNNNNNHNNNSGRNNNRRAPLAILLTAYMRERYKTVQRNLDTRQLGEFYVTPILFSLFPHYLNLYWGYDPWFKQTTVSFPNRMLRPKYGWKWFTSSED